MACQNAQYEADAAKQTHAKSDDALLTIAAVRKMTAESHCNRIRAVGASRQNLELCKKGPKTPDCALSCGKVKAIIDDGIPAAAFAPLTKEHEENCKHLK
jgi:rhamnose utilization protein RhaD (predicted bifunctional aldolase and dehydrogenase)